LSGNTNYDKKWQDCVAEHSPGFSFEWNDGASLSGYSWLLVDIRHNLIDFRRRKLENTRQFFHGDRRSMPASIIMLLTISEDFS